ncbi:hypothetical protein QR680_012311 [Steinernema hermaphroditum]|uniref:C-type lectin domain-containing protein n=1 Tax=Steinernema hermaphroditum TaxID=289476 RepID=A0AA39I1M5_9BILA|nr:hypothetical protein QR680_012311 [Steinernema hermaphroditum]
MMRRSLILCLLVAVGSTTVVLNYEELHGSTVVGDSVRFQQFDFDFVACARNFLYREDIDYFTYAETDRKCFGFTNVTGRTGPVEGTRTYVIKRPIVWIIDDGKSSNKTATQPTTTTSKPKTKPLTTTKRPVTTSSTAKPTTAKSTTTTKQPKTKPPTTKKPITTTPKTTSRTTASKKTTLKTTTTTRKSKITTATKKVTTPKPITTTTKKAKPITTTTKAPVAAKRKPVASCKKGFVQYKDRCYGGVNVVHEGDDKNMQKVIANVCQKSIPNGRPASIRDAEENEFLRKIVASKGWRGNSVPDKNLIIGMNLGLLGSSALDKKRFSWMDNNTVTYTNYGRLSAQMEWAHGWRWMSIDEHGRWNNNRPFYYRKATMLCYYEL